MLTHIHASEQMLTQRICCFVAYLLLFLGWIGCNKGEEKKSAEKNYIFFLHHRFLEEHDTTAIHPEYGKAEYGAIIETFRKAGFEVFSEKRAFNTDGKEYARKIQHQVDSLLHSGVEARHITIIGCSKGGYIAQYVSTYCANPALNFVFIGCFQEGDVKELPDIQFCGNILSIYEQSDTLGVSARRRTETSRLSMPHFREIELHTQRRHGFVYKALAEWLQPCMQWARQNYELQPNK